MPLAAGTRLGPYEVLTLIGAGGMGEVYRARDTRLARDVAIKVSKERFSERFEREAKAIASLNHPNICQLYDVGENYLVMEFIDGQTLAGPLALETAIGHARQIAEALEYAHERGIVHRDLKPANVKVTPEGVVKVLDFGLAKALEDPAATLSDAGNSPTLTMGATRAGVILGTAAYMSPEQAHGKAADRRADVFSFGAVLFEMLTGKQAFSGESIGDTLASVLKLDPAWESLPAETPAAIRTLLRRCLIKDRKQRLQAIGEARIVLENPAHDPPPSQAGPVRRTLLAPWIAAAVFAVVAGVALWGWLKPVTPEARIVTHFTMPLPRGTVPTTPDSIALSRDGSRIAFVGPQRLIYVRPMDQLEAKPIPGTEGAAFLSFSPDGQWISYVDTDTPSHLRRVAVAGGPTQILAEVTGPGIPNTSWAEDGNIYFSSKGALMRVAEAGGKPETLATGDAKTGEALYFGAQLLPGGKELLFSSAPVFRTMALNLKTGKKTILLDNAPGIAQYLPAAPGPAVGHLLYFALTSGSLMAVAFDASQLRVSGSPVPVLERVQQAIGPFASFGFSGSGTLAYVQGAAVSLPPSTLAWVDRKGAEQPLPEPPHSFTLPRLSPTGDRAAIDILTGSQFPPSSDIWIYDLVRHGLTKVTFDGSSVAAVWTPDGKRLLYLAYPAANHYEIRSVPADSSGPPTTLLAVDNTAPYLPHSISPDGKVLIGYRVSGSTTEPSITFALTLPEGSSPDAKQDAKPQLFLDPKPTKTAVQFSPDGKWVAYASTETGRSEIYVVPYPGPGGKVLVSSEGGTLPHWAGRELFYRNGDKMLAVDFETAPTFRAGTPKVLFESRNVNYDVAPDGKRFLMLKPVAEQQTEQAQLHVVVNWSEELRRRVPVK